jgi:hypothetical protein
MGAAGAPLARVETIIRARDGRWLAVIIPVIVLDINAGIIRAGVLSK